MTLNTFGLEEPPRTGVRDRVLLLRSLANFQGLDDEGLTLLAEHARNRVYRRGEVLTTDGDVTQSLHIVLEGQVSLSRKGKTLGIVRSGQALGLLAVVAQAPAGNAVADEDTRTLEVPAPAFQAALEENFSLLRNSLRLMGAALLRSRGNLPGDPDHPPPVDVGAFDARPRTLVERVLELHEAAFSTVNVDALVDLARHTVEIHVPAGHVFWSVGDPSTHAVHVKYGRIRCTSADGRFMDVGSNFTIGVMDLWGATARSYEARAETPVIGNRVDFEDFLLIIETHAHVGLRMLGSFANALLARAEAGAGHVTR